MMGWEESRRMKMYRSHFGATATHTVVHYMIHSREFTMHQKSKIFEIAKQINDQYGDKTGRVRWEDFGRAIRVWKYRQKDRSL